MGHNVERAVLASKLGEVMGMPLGRYDTRSQRRHWESNVIIAYNKMVVNLKSLLNKLGLSHVHVSDDAWSNKRTHDAIVNALAGYDLNRTIQVIENEIIHDADEIERLQGIHGEFKSDEVIGEPVTSSIKMLNRTIAEKTKFLNQYKSGLIFVDVATIIDKIQKSNDLKRAIEGEKQRILLEDERSEEYFIDQLNKQADTGIDLYNEYKTQRAKNVIEYSEWLANEQKVLKEKQESLKSSFVGTEDVTIPTTEPTVIAHNDEHVEEVIKIDEPTKSKISAGIIALGVIGVFLALKSK